MPTTKSSRAKAARTSTASHRADAAFADAPLLDTIPYPISPDYVKGWTPVRALAELVANALDETSNVRIEWKDGILEIEDDGPGVPAEGLILGYSSKSMAQIGQFGEGAKIASLVLARARGIRGVCIDTVGYALVPRIEAHGFLTNLVPSSGKAPQVLTYRIFKSTRTRGTLVRVACAESLAKDVLGRFLHFTPGYTSPPSPGRVLLDVPPGRLYVGGVLVSEGRDLLFSYDLALADAKALLNRDRTVVDSWEIQRRVGAVLAACDDIDVLERIARAILDGKISQAERSISRPNYAQRRRWAEVRARIFGEEKVCYSEGTDESVLDIEDRGYRVLVAKSDAYLHAMLMRLLDIPPVAKVAAHRARPKGAPRTHTTWVDVKDLTEWEASTWAEALQIVAGTWGAGFAANVRLYSATTFDGAEVGWDGFYDPRGGGVAVARSALVSLERTVEVLVHENGHRKGHRGNRRSGYQDRTRGFEETLQGLAATAAIRLHRAGVLTQVDLATASTRKIPVRAYQPNAALAALIEERLEFAGDRSAAAFCARTGIKVAHLRQLRGGLRIQSRDTITALAEALGLDWSVVWLASNGAEGPYLYKSERSLTRRWPTTMRLIANAATARLREVGGAHAAVADEIDALVAGNVEVPTHLMENAPFYAMFCDLVVAERVRLRPAEQLAASLQ